MLGAHLVPGYFAAFHSKSKWHPEWTKTQRLMLWSVALGSTALPDFDVIYNALFRGFINHSVLWTHSLFPYTSLTLIWWLLRRNGHYPFAQTIVGLLAFGGFSHLLLDVIVHSTPLFYPLTPLMIGNSSARVLQGGFWAYVTDPIFLLEPLLFAVAVIHWALTSNLSPHIRTAVIIVSVKLFLIFTSTFLILLPTLQSSISP
jgi:hypothetical protein